MKEVVLNRIWSIGGRARDLAKRRGLLGPMDVVVRKLATLLVPPPSSETEFAMSNGMTMVIPPGFPSGRSYINGTYEHEVVSVFQAAVKSSTNVVDIGANVGYYTLLASGLVGPDGCVYAFEPDPLALQYLEQNVERNQCGNVVIIGEGVSEIVGQATFVRDKYGAEGYVARVASASSTVIQIETTNLDAYFESIGWPSVDLVKMDIEGGEMAALEGMGDLSQRNPGLQIIMEYDLENLRRVSANRESVASVLQELGFTHGHVIEQGMRPFQVADGLPKTKATYDLLLKKR